MERIEQYITIQNTHGLHIRPASEFVQLANKFDSSVLLEKDANVCDGKSIIAILSLGLNQGMSVKLIVEGVDAPQAFQALKEVLEGNHD